MVLGCAACGRSPMDMEDQRRTQAGEPDPTESGSVPASTGSEGDGVASTPTPTQTTPSASTSAAVSPAVSPTPSPVVSPAVSPAVSLTPSPVVSPVVSPTTTPTVPVEPSDGVCNPMGYCWAQPQPFGDRIIKMHGTADASAIFAVSAGGALLEHSNGEWRYVEIDGGEPVQTVHVVSENDIWAGTTDAVYQKREGQWTRMRDGSPRAIAADPTGDVWAVSGKQVLRWDGQQWHDETPGEAVFIDVATNADGVWLLAIENIGRKTRCFPYHLASGVWKELPGPLEEYSIGGQNAGLVVAGNDVYLNCNHENESGEFFGRIGETWEPLDGLGGPTWAASDGTLFSGHAVWRPQDGFVGTLPVSPTAVWGSSRENVWVGLPDGGVARLDGMTLEVETSPPRSSASDWDTTPPEIWANATAAWGNAADDVWRTPLEHYDGRAWTRVSEATARAIHGSATNNVWFALQPSADSPLADTFDVARVAWWDGETLREMALPEDWIGFTLTTILTFGPNDTWVGGSKDGEPARIGRYDGTTWRIMHEEAAAVDYYVGLTGYWLSIQGTSPFDLWAMSGNRLIRLIREQTIVYTDQSLGSAALKALAITESDVFVLSLDGVHTIYNHNDQTDFQARRFGYEYMDRLAFRAGHIWVYDQIGRALYSAR